MPLSRGPENPGWDVPVRTIVAFENIVIVLGQVFRVEIDARVANVQIRLKPESNELLERTN